MLVHPPQRVLLRAFAKNTLTSFFNRRMGMRGSINFSHFRRTISQRVQRLIMENA